MPRNVKTMKQESAYASPWSFRERTGMLLWVGVWLVLFRPTPKFLNRWRLLLLRLFGCRIRGVPFVSESARIKMPWRLTLGHRACLGPYSEIYNLDEVILKPFSTVAQHSYLCGGTHDLSQRSYPLQTGKIVIGRWAFVGAHALILPGVVVGEDAVVGAGSVVTRDVPPRMICAGNPCRPITPRVLND